MPAVSRSPCRTGTVHTHVFVLVMGAGSIAGSFVGCQMLGVVLTFVLLPMLAAVLLVAAVKVCLPGRHPLKIGQG